ncbi:protease-associated domain-containing protein 1-like [Tubulanus polymorphus]|uniref:protease-associated domain-containing protein 1-like n=1 Tax=Tubulanus polymorphus TaxID=672921 RepID=UPI003DA4AFBF
MTTFSSFCFLTRKILKYLPKYVMAMLFVLEFINISTADNRKIVTKNLLDPDSDLYFYLIHPKHLSYFYRIRPAKDFGKPLNFTMNGIYLVPVEPIQGCGEITNSLIVKDNIAFVVRGECSFVSKSLQAEAAGARAIIIFDKEEKNDDMYIDMIHDGTKRESNLPAFFLLGKNGWMIQKSLEAMKMSHAIIDMPINVTGIPTNDFMQPPWTLW